MSCRLRKWPATEDAAAARMPKPARPAANLCRHLWASSLGSIAAIGACGWRCVRGYRVPIDAKIARAPFASQPARAGSAPSATIVGWQENADAQQTPGPQLAFGAVRCSTRGTSVASAQGDANTMAGAKFLATADLANAAASHSGESQARDSARWRACIRRRSTPACAAKSHSRRRYTRAETTHAKRSIARASAPSRHAAENFQRPSDHSRSQAALRGGSCRGAKMSGR